MQLKFVLPATISNQSSDWYTRKEVWVIMSSKVVWIADYFIRGAVDKRTVMMRTWLDREMRGTRIAGTFSVAQENSSQKVLSAEF